MIGHLEPLGTESVPAALAAGRVLARLIRADRDRPPFETSAMDGYAVRLSDATALPALLRGPFPVHAPRARRLSLVG